MYSSKEQSLGAAFITSVMTSTLCNGVNPLALRAPSEIHKACSHDKNENKSISMTDERSVPSVPTCVSLGEMNVKGVRSLRLILTRKNGW